MIDGAATESACAAQRMDALGRLAGGVAHDLNNVLMVITGYCEMLVETMESNREARDGLCMIAEAAQRAVGITRQLQLFGRRQVAETCEVSLSQAIPALVPAIKKLVPETAAVQVEVEAAGLLVCIDPAHLERLVTGLSVFSRDAVPEGGTLTVTARTVAQPAFTDAWGDQAPAGDYVRLSVAHSAAIEPGARSRVFEPFFTTKPIGKGAGLALAVAYGIVKTSRGYIDVTTNGCGSRFDVHLPLVTSELQRAPRADGAAAPARQA